MWYLHNSLNHLVKRKNQSEMRKHGYALLKTGIKLRTIFLPAKAGSVFLMMANVHQLTSSVMFVPIYL
jgi:hypothetical protein